MANHLKDSWNTVVYHNKIEDPEGVANACKSIAKVEGIDAPFIEPSRFWPCLTVREKCE
ncbi:hypothetical protein OH492_17175 [Vibrio chagasii]|nr:hypothetical protein [Vibrio chagasii]